ncbi:MAG: AAA family ATPase [Nitrososphaeria archaeon]
MEKPKIFKDETKLFPEYIPKKTPHREMEVNKLKSLFDVVLQNPAEASQQVFILGPVGSGKTLVSKKFLQYIDEQYQTNAIRIKTYYTNCRVNKVFSSILNNILATIGHSFPNRGFSVDEIVQYFLSVSLEENVHIISVFDEFDALVAHEGVEPLYIITRIREMAKDRQILSSIIISKTFSYLDKADRGILSSIQKNIIKLEAYSETQLNDILFDRILMAFNEGTVGNETTELIAKIASRYGDARYAIELLHLAGRIADFRGEDRVRPDHVREAKLQLPPQIRKEEIGYLDDHEKILLLSLSKLLKENLGERVTLKELQQEYNMSCEEYNKTPLKYTQLWIRIKDLVQRDLISAEVSSRGHRGKTTFISLLNVPAEQIYNETKERLKNG